MTSKDVATQIEIEGVDYALTQKIQLKKLYAIDNELGRLAEAYQDLREQVLYRLQELDPDFDPLEYI